jgi:hypothetical protein
MESAVMGNVRAIPSLSSFEWLRDRAETLRTTADTVIAEALEIVAYDSAFIGAKVHRALDGRDRFEHDAVVRR